MSLKKKIDILTSMAGTIEMWILFSKYDEFKIINFFEIEGGKLRLIDYSDHYKIVLNRIKILSIKLQS